MAEDDPLELEASWEILRGPRPERGFEVIDPGLPEKRKGYFWMGLRHRNVEIRHSSRQSVPILLDGTDMTGTFEASHEEWRVTGVGLWLSRTGTDLVYTKDFDEVRIRPKDSFRMSIRLTVTNDEDDGLKIRKLLQLLGAL
jgi:hypothetical protein